jgi:hypothetical protein
MTDPGIEALKLIADWAKWLITIEATAIAVIGAAIRGGEAPRSIGLKLSVTLAITCFVISIAAAAFLLLSLPEIAQSYTPGMNVWLMADSVIGGQLETLATIESFFFGCGVVCFAAMIVVAVWTPDHDTSPPEQRR